MRWYTKACLGLPLALALLGRTALAADMAQGPAPEFTHRAADEWLNSPPLTLAGLRGKVVLVEFWAFDCANCLHTHAWVESVAHSKKAAGLVVVGVHTPELPQEKSPANVRAAVQRLGIDYPVMLDGDYSYWHALDNHYWPGFYLIDRDGRLVARAYGELHVGEDNARKVEGAIDRLLAAPAT